MIKHFKCSLRACFPHKVWVKDWQRSWNKLRKRSKCKEKFSIDRITPPVTYIYDSLTKHICYVCKTPRPDALIVNNWLAYHACVDGGLIKYGFSNYMFDINRPQGRCDSMVFDNKDLWFIEFKMNVTSSLDAQLWKDLKDGMDQLEDFVLNLRYKMAKKRTPLNCYYPINHQHCSVCMKTYPTMSIQRNNNLEKFRQATGLTLQQKNAIP